MTSPHRPMDFPHTNLHETAEQRRGNIRSLYRSPCNDTAHQWPHGPARIIVPNRVDEENMSLMIHAELFNFSVLPSKVSLFQLVFIHTKLPFGGASASEWQRKNQAPHWLITFDRPDSPCLMKGLMSKTCG